MRLYYYLQLECCVVVDVSKEYGPYLALFKRKFFICDPKSTEIS